MGSSKTEHQRSHKENHRCSSSIRANPWRKAFFESCRTSLLIRLALKVSRVSKKKNKQSAIVPDLSHSGTKGGSGVHTSWQLTTSWNLPQTWVRICWTNPSTQTIQTQPVQRTPHTFQKLHRGCPKHPKTNCMHWWGKKQQHAFGTPGVRAWLYHSLRNRMIPFFGWTFPVFCVPSRSSDQRSNGIPSTNDRTSLRPVRIFRSLKT